MYPESLGNQTLDILIPNCVNSPMKKIITLSLIGALGVGIIAVMLVDTLPTLAKPNLVCGGTTVRCAPIR